ncbi:MAG: peptidase M23 [Flavobacteriales bacterium]|nr:peptidase M23 [Flavobacteriales bacterium]
MKKPLGFLLLFFAIFLMLKTILEKETIEIDLEPVYEYGILTDTFLVTREVVKSGQTIGEILYSNHIDHPQINKLVKKSKKIFDVRLINSGNKYTIMKSKDSTQKAQFFIYEQDVVNYIVFDLRNEMDVYKGKKEVVVKLKRAFGQIDASLWLTMEEKKLSPRLTHELSTIYAWTIDFFKIQKGDNFHIYYEDRYIDDQYIGIGKILASEFFHNGEKHYAFYYKSKDYNHAEYYDENGKTLRKAFLMAPVDYKRISSRFSRNRKHPVTGQWKGHFGTDYAAAPGTPIWATANGTVTRASYTRNNGNYVKIRHNKTYSTQYLHMSKIKPGIKKGVYVKQGDCIGYVGSTGLATGPHVCYRFWKNGRQVDPFKEKLPPGDPIKKEEYNDYMIFKDSLYTILKSD